MLQSHRADVFVIDVDVAGSIVPAMRQRKPARAMSSAQGVQSSLDEEGTVAVQRACERETEDVLFMGGDATHVQPKQSADQ